jgi:hypothetical protein
MPGVLPKAVSGGQGLLEGSAFDSHFHLSGHHHSCLEDTRTQQPLAHHWSAGGSFQAECTQSNLIDIYRISLAQIM